MSRVSEAEKEIARILRQLEIDTGEVVDTLTLGMHEVTCVDDDRKRFMNRVFITTYRLPGNEWACE